MVNIFSTPIARDIHTVLQIHTKILNYLAVSQVIDLLANVGDVRFGLIVGCAACNVSVGLGESKGGAFQSHVDRVGQCGMVSLWVIALDLIHPALMTNK